MSMCPNIGIAPRIPPLRAAESRAPSRRTGLRARRVGAPPRPSRRRDCAVGRKCEARDAEPRDRSAPHSLDRRMPAIALARRMHCTSPRIAIAHTARRGTSERARHRRACPDAHRRAPPPSPPSRSLAAARRTHEIHLDGILDEQDWSLAGVATHFTQRYPDPGKPATYQTEVRVLYDDDAIYVGARMYDAHPDSIVAPMARRDPQDIYSDWFDVIFDSYHDRRTGFRFGVNPAGTKLDVYHFNDGDDDDAWDARWDVATHVDSLGWTAEYRIPLSQLRFHGSALEQTWGLQFYRDVARLDEWTFWSPYPPTAPGFVSNFGDLGGLDGTPARVADRHRSVREHAHRHRSHGRRAIRSRAARARVATAGGDFRVGLGSALSLHGTDQSGLRPGGSRSRRAQSLGRRDVLPREATVLSRGRGNLRVRRAPRERAIRLLALRALAPHWPHARSSRRAATFTDIPDQTTILGATKLSGRTSNGLSLGFVDAVTAHEDASVVDSDGSRHEVGVEPLTNYFVGRVKKDLDDGRATIGVLGTATNRSMDADFAPLPPLPCVSLRRRRLARFREPPLDARWLLDRQPRRWQRRRDRGDAAVERALLRPPGRRATSRFDTTRRSLTGTRCVGGDRVSGHADVRLAPAPRDEPRLRDERPRLPLAQRRALARRGVRHDARCIVGRAAQRARHRLHDQRLELRRRRLLSRDRLHEQRRAAIAVERERARGLLAAHGRRPPHARRPARASRRAAGRRPEACRATCGAR